MTTQASPSARRARHRTSAASSALISQVSLLRPSARLVAAARNGTAEAKAENNDNNELAADDSEPTQCPRKFITWISRALTSPPTGTFASPAPWPLAREKMKTRYLLKSRYFNRPLNRCDAMLLAV